MKFDLLDKAKRDLAAVEQEHARTVHKAAATVRASKTKLDAAQRRVRDMEFAAMSAEVATNKERALQLR